MQLQSIDINQFTVEIPKENFYGGKINLPLRDGQRIEALVYHKHCPIPKYSLLIQDSRNKRSLRQKNLSVFIVPQGQEKSYSFSNEGGQMDLHESIGSSRLIIVTLNHGFTFETMDWIQQELIEVVRALAPPNIVGQISFTTNGDIGERSLVCMSDFFVVEDVKERDYYLRQLIFLSNINQVQCEIRAIVNEETQKPLIQENSSLVLEADFSYISVEYLRAHLVVLAIYPDLVLESSFSLLMLGAGACILPTFLAKYFDNIQITAVDINPHMIEIGRKYFNAEETPQINVVIEDGAAFTERTSETYDWLIIDVSTGEESAPPSNFTSPEFLQTVHQKLSPKGVLSINVIASSSATDVVLANVVSVFANSYIAKCKEDTNLTVYCLRDPEPIDVYVLQKSMEKITELKQWDVCMALTQYASWLKPCPQPRQIVLPPKKKKKRRR